MNLQCTKSLLGYLGVTPEEATCEKEPDPLCTWTANLLTVNRRKTILVVHAASRCQFVLHGITAKSITQLPKLILDGVRALLQSEYVRPEVIEKYLDDCGRTVSYTANSSRKIVAACNKASEIMREFSLLFDPEDLYQSTLLPWINHAPVGSADFKFAHEILTELLKETYGENIHSCRAAELTVTLELNSPCSRTLIVPADLNLHQLHNILQGALEWHENHLHQFVLKRNPDGSTALNVLPPYDDDIDVDMGLWDIPGIDSTDITIAEAFSAYPQIDYEYDFGDGWFHTIKLNRFIEDCADPCPRCIAAVGDAPMEDCGGPDAFEEIMKILEDPSHPEYANISDWMESIWWDHLDIDRINRRIANRYRQRFPVVYE